LQKRPIIFRSLRSLLIEATLYPNPSMLTLPRLQSYLDTNMCLHRQTIYLDTDMCLIAHPYMCCSMCCRKDEVFWSLSTFTWSLLQYVAVCCSVLQCIAVCCSVLQERRGLLVSVDFHMVSFDVYQSFMSFFWWRLVSVNA